MYAAMLMALMVLALAGAGMLLFLIGAEEGGAIRTMLPAWALLPVAIVNALYAIAIIVVLSTRRLNSEAGKHFTQWLNWALLPALPGGTIVGIQRVCCQIPRRNSSESIRRQ